MRAELEPKYLTINLWKDSKAGYPQTLVEGQRWRFTRSTFKRLVYDLRLGFGSGYPWCCVLEFSFRWAVGFPKLLNPERNHRRDRRKSKGYICCLFHE